jgi:hypothetical protein
LTNDGVMDKPRPAARSGWVKTHETSNPSASWWSKRACNCWAAKAGVPAKPTLRRSETGGLLKAVYWLTLRLDEFLLDSGLLEPREIIYKNAPI